MEIAEIRRAQLKAWFAKRKIPAEEKSYLSQLIGGKASFGEKAARRLEQTYKMPTMYLDTPADAATPDAAPLKKDQAELLEIWGWLLDTEKAEVLATIRPKAAHNKEAAKQFAPDVRVRTVSISERRLSNQAIPFADRRKDHA